MTRKRLVLIVSIIICAPSFLQSSGSNASETKSASPMPLPFTKNMGQWPDSILFRASANGATMWFTKNGIWYQFFHRVEKTDASATAIDPTVLGRPQLAVGTEEQPDSIPVGGRRPRLPHEDQPDSIETTMIKAEFVGASEFSEVVGLEELEYKCNYFIGNEPSNWRTDVPNYSAVTMRGLYPGVDVTFASHEGRLESKILAASSSDLASVKVEFRGANNVDQQTSTSALVQTSFGEHTFEGILLSDGTASKSEQPASSATSSASGVSLVYGTYLGGSRNDEGTAIAVDARGNAYLTGSTLSTNFPIKGPYQTSSGGWEDVFVTKIESTGSELVYSTYLGGDYYDNAEGIAVDAGGNAYIIGTAGSKNFPIESPFQASFGGNSDAFVTKISSSGSGLVYSTYLGGEATEYGRGIAVDALGNAYATGWTESTNFPTENPLQSSQNGRTDSFVTKFNSAGNGLIYSTYLGGNFDDYSRGIAVDAQGNACVTGSTTSTDFPTQNSFQTSNSGYYDAFVIKINNVGSELIFSTYLGRIGYDNGWSIAIDFEGNTYVAGVTENADFPTLNAFQASFGGYVDIFVTKFNSAGSGLVYSTFLGGSGSDVGLGIAVDAAGNAYVTGSTASIDSTNFPTLNPFQDTIGGGQDAIVSKINTASNGLVYSTFLGGSTSDVGNGIAVDATGNAYIVGHTFSTDFPTQGPFQPSISGTQDAFVTKFAAYDPTGVGHDPEATLPATFLVSQNYPNPFNPSTTIEYSVPTRTHVEIEVFNILGQSVRHLVNETKSAGTYQLTWDGTDQGGKSVSTGVYLYRFQAGNEIVTKKMLFLK
jgi:Beta-propeller repeat/FlgD Ig-like domain